MFQRFVSAAALAAAIALPTVACAGQAAQSTGPDNGGASAASQQQPQGHRRGNIMMRALRGITLTEDQKAQVKTLGQEMRQQNQAQQGQPIDAATRKANREKFVQQIEAILTPAQRTQFEANLTSMRGHRPGAEPAPAETPQS